MEQFDALLAQTIDSTLGLRCTLLGYQYSEILRSLMCLIRMGKVSLSAAYKISVYATADGYTASDKAEATLYWINANLENGTNINQVRTRGVVASAHDGIISLSGLDDGEVVKFFAAIKKSYTS